MAEDLEELCGRISHSDRENEGISINEGEIAVLCVKGSRCLVGHLDTEKWINNDAFRSLLTWLWRPGGSVLFQKIHEHLWIFKFSDGDDKRRVMEGCLWSFDRFIFVLEEFDGNLSLSQMEFKFSPFWV